MVFLEASGPAPPDLCWERYAVPAAWPGWAPQIRAVEIESAGRAPAGTAGLAGPAGAAAGAYAGQGHGTFQGHSRDQDHYGWRPCGEEPPGADAGRWQRIVPGLRGQVHPLAGPAARFLVTAVDEFERTWSWRVGIGPLRLDLDHGVDACLDGGTSTWLRITGPGPLPHAYAPLARVALRRIVR
ncbi:SRPBCC family protein [Frankia sp. Hr75.2]|nr:SRPBCC family protein [Frankia sp. Hr75.2]